MREDAECRSYVNHLFAEHRRLQHLLRQARKAIVGGGDRKSPVECAAALVDVEHELRRHFAEEEAGGCLDEAVSRCPGLSTEVGTIEADHPRLLARLEALVRRAQDCRGTPESRVELGRDFDDLLRDLQAHEAAENNVLRKGFGSSFAEYEAVDRPAVGEE
jgi:iron-sulfur cluster repair protein YtfE (RIC family)